MKVQNYYEIELIVNKELFEAAPESISFRMQDSIHEFFPTLSFQFNDTTGLFQELLATTEGIIAQLTYGENETTIKNRYVITSDELTDTYSNGILNGRVNIDLKHEFYNSQSVVSTAYEDRISNIVRSIANKFQFSEIKINDTGNQDVWYQPQMTDARFIRKNLLPYAFSRNAGGTPFFCFIDSANRFHFQNYAAMMNAKPVTVLRYLPESEEVSKDRNAIRGISRLRTGSDVTRHLRKRTITLLDAQNGKLVEEEDSILDAPAGKIRQLPIVGSLDDPTGSVHLGFTGTTTGEKENDRGYQAYTVRDSFFLDRFVITLPLNLALVAGKTVELDISKWTSDDGSESSLTFRGSYLVEQSTHDWDGNAKEGRTILVVSRKTMDVPNTYYLKGQLIQN